MTKQALKISRHHSTAPNNCYQQDAVARFSVHAFQTLTTDGRVTGVLPDFARDPEQLIALYRIMVKTRVFDQKAMFLQRRGQLGTYASSLGQEAVGAAIGSAMADDDVLFPAYREYAAQFQRGVSMTEILLYWGGNEQGMNYQKQAHDFPICVPIASQAPQAIGAAYAFSLRKQKRVAVCVLGDGATSKGDFYEAINAAGAWQLPIVFVINNNRWAISLPRNAQSRAETLAQKAIGAGFAGEQVDGNDVIALKHRINLALERARKGSGSTLIEALTYRLCDHTTADDASRYRNDHEVQQQWQIEPLQRLRQYLEALGCWGESDEQQLQGDCNRQVEQAVKNYLDTTPQSPESMFDYLYQSLPTALEEQRQLVVTSKVGGHND